ncbi:MAG: stage III sporulation protein AE [Eubacteriales bacterium]|nr:stage III sporulation protein AE [Eubacteriales bacterium]
MKWLALALLLTLIPCPAAGQTLTEGVTQMLDGLDLSPLEEAVGASDPFAATGGFRQTLQGIALGQLTLDFDQVMQLITSRFCSAVTGSLWRLTRLAAPALIWSLLCRLLGKKSEAGQVVCMLMICVFLVSDLSDHTALCLRSVERMSSGMQGLFPLLLTVMAALGGSAGSALMQPAVVASAGAMTALIRHVTLPLAVCGATLTMLCHLGSSIRLDRLAGLARQAANWTLGVGFTVFIGVIMTRGVTAAAVDGVTLRTAKYALDNFVPVVGGLFADTVDTLVGSGMLVQGALGVTGLMLVCAWCLTPLCQTLAAAMLYKLTAALLQPLADGELIRCIDDFSGVLMLLFIIQLCTAAMFLMLMAQLIGVSGMTMMLR